MEPNETRSDAGGAAVGRRLLRELFVPLDPLLEDAAKRGELLVAHVRLLVLALLLPIQFLPGWAPSFRAVGLVVNTLALAWAVAIAVLAHARYRPWIAWLSSLVDVSLVSLGLVLYLVAGLPHVAVNSRVLYEVYFLVLVAASLRYDWRVCLLSGAAAVAQFAALVSWADAHYDLNHPRWAPFVYGQLIWPMHYARLLLLGVVSIVSAAVAFRAQRLRALSSTDRLTGLYNRGAFDERLAEEVERSRRYARPLVVALVDIDHFKHFNDTHGHAGGDTALRAVGDVLRGALRRVDVVARYGGEEFGLILPETRAEDALPRLQALRLAVQETAIATHKGRAPHGVTISVGVAGCPEDGSEAADVVRLADVRLYAAKRRGRNRVIGPFDAIDEVTPMPDRTPTPRPA